MKDLNNETPAVGEVPPKPEGCAYGPWFDKELELWFSIDSWGSVHYLSSKKWIYNERNAASRELLRVSAQNQPLRALVGELAEGLEKLAADYRWAKQHQNIGYAEDHPVVVAHALIAKAKEAGL